MVKIYILKCEENKYYIGKTHKNVLYRFKKHQNGYGAIWTKKYKPIKILEIYLNCDNFDEDKYTKIYMDKYGIDNVRGGSYTKINLSNSTIKFLQKELLSIHDKCYGCGKKGHFYKSCKKYSNKIKYNNDNKLCINDLTSSDSNSDSSEYDSDSSEYNSSSSSSSSSDCISNTTSNYSYSDNEINVIENSS